MTAHVGRTASEPQETVTRWKHAYSAGDACVAELLCDRHPADARALIVVGADLSVRESTYGELREASERVARGLAEMGVVRGDRVATLMGKSVELVVSQLAIWRLGAVYMPLFTAFGPGGIAFRLRDAGAAAVICDATQRPKLDPGEDIPENAPWRIVTVSEHPAPGDVPFSSLLASETGHPAVPVGGQAPMLQLYTSGTTGSAKGVVVPTWALASFQAYATYGLDIRADDVFWNAADPGWAYGLYYGIVSPLLLGHPFIQLASGFSADLTWRVLSELGVTNLAIAPTALRAMRASDTPVPSALSLRCVSTAGEPLNPEIMTWGRRVFGTTVRDHYGQTELGMAVVNGWHPDVRQEPRPGSMGQPLPGWSLEVLDLKRDEPAPQDQLGRVAVDVPASPLMWFREYYRNPEKTGERFSGDGRWYYTGDVARRDADGDFFFASRDDDVILMAGYRIGPTDVESALLHHDAVAEAGVCAVPDEVRGEVIHAYCVLRAGVTPHEGLAEELREVVRQRYAAHAYPRRFHFVDSLPKTESGKVMRHRLRDMARAELAAGV
jgi:acetyl-CoA synthetase